eukprot:scaffold7551_cov168-Amphora_coffeaeformis.AAC.3
MAHMVSVNWKASSVDEKRYYEMLAQEEGRRQSEREQSTLLKNLTQLQQQPQLTFTGITDLPVVVEEVFDNVQILAELDPILEFEQIAVQKGPAPAVLAVPAKKPRLTTQAEQASMDQNACNTSSKEMSAQIIDHQRTLEKSFGVMPSLLGDIPDDAPWPI